MMGRRKERRPLVDPVFSFFLSFFAVFLFLFGIFILQSTLTESNKEKAKTKIKEIKIANSHTYHLNLNCKPLSKSIENTTCLHLHTIFNC